ncbi:MAG: AraC family transcriptional regulator [Blautia sp.]|jgi:AraC-like DNA-binding protein
MAYESILLTEEIHISRIVTIHYFEYMNDFYFPGEIHNFWEFQCVDKGEVNIIAGDVLHTLKKGQVIFHKPNEFHNLQANGKIAPNVVVIAFECDSPAMSFFKDRILDITEQERSLMAMIITEARRCISSPLDDPYLEKMDKREDRLFGSEQFIKLYLEEMLLHMIRRNTAQGFANPISKLFKTKSDSLLYNKILLYLEAHIREPITIEEICRENLIGRSQLQKIFQREHQCGVIDFFSQMKIELAKQLIREHQLNFTQISEFLGYSSIHYFSRQFKKISGMTPSEYASSIKALSERKREADVPDDKSLF